MKINEFLAYLPWLRLPKILSIQNNETEIHERSEILRTTPITRPTPYPLDNAPEEIKALYQHYDLSSIHMLWTSFLSEPKQVLEGWHFATMSEARIVLTPSGRVEAYNDHPIQAIHGDSEFLGDLAQDMESYLEALLCGQMNKAHFASGFGDEPGVREKLEPVVQLCTAIAGGEEFRDFWEGALGL